MGAEEGGVVRFVPLLRRLAGFVDSAPGDEKPRVYGDSDATDVGLCDRGVLLSDEMWFMGRWMWIWDGGRGMGTGTPLGTGTGRGTPRGTWVDVGEYR